MLQLAAFVQLKRRKKNRVGCLISSVYKHIIALYWKVWNLMWYKHVQIFQVQETLCKEQLVKQTTNMSFFVAYNSISSKKDDSDLCRYRFEKTLMVHLLHRDIRMTWWGGACWKFPRLRFTLFTRFHRQFLWFPSFSATSIINFYITLADPHVIFRKSD